MHGKLSHRGEVVLPDDFLSHVNSLKEIVENTNSQQLIFFKRKKSGFTSKYEAYNFELDQNSIGSNLKNIVLSSIETNSTCRLKNYTIELDSNETNVIYEIASRDIGNFRKIIEAMSDGSLNRINVATTEEIDPNFYVLNFDNNGEQLMAFTHYSPATTFKSKLIFKNQAEIYDKCLSIATYVHCLYYRIKLNNEQYIENVVIFKTGKSKFEQIFDYKEDYRARATATIRELESLNLISNADVFELKAMNDEYFIRKLAKIHLENKIEIVRNNFESLVQANNDFQELGVQINTETQTILIPHNADKDYIRSVLSLLNTEPMQNLISQAKVLIPDNNTPIQQRLFLV